MCATVGRQFPALGGCQIACIASLDAFSLVRLGSDAAPGLAFSQVLIGGAVVCTTPGPRCRESDALKMSNMFDSNMVNTSCGT